MLHETLPLHTRVTGCTQHSLLGLWPGWELVLFPVKFLSELRRDLREVNVQRPANLVCAFSWEPATLEEGPVTLGAPTWP